MNKSNLPHKYKSLGFFLKGVLTIQICQDLSSANKAPFACDQSKCHNCIQSSQRSQGQTCSPDFRQHSSKAIARGSSQSPSAPQKLSGVAPNGRRNQSQSPSAVCIAYARSNQAQSGIYPNPEKSKSRQQCSQCPSAAYKQAYVDTLWSVATLPLLTNKKSFSTT